jgi:redox-regulated HSP33 family molecular chaperone
MSAAVILSIVSVVAMILLIIRRENTSEKIKMLLGGVAVASGIIAVSLIAEKL